MSTGEALSAVIVGKQLGTVNSQTNVTKLAAEAKAQIFYPTLCMGIFLGLGVEWKKTLICMWHPSNYRDGTLFYIMNVGFYFLECFTMFCVWKCASKSTYGMT